MPTAEPVFTSLADFIRAQPERPPSQPPAGRTREPEPLPSKSSQPEPLPSESSQPEPFVRSASFQPEPLRSELFQAEPLPPRSAQPEPLPQRSSQPDGAASRQAQPEFARAGVSAAGVADGPAPRLVAWAQPVSIGNAEYGAVLREARLFQAALADAFESRLASIARSLAVEVLGRELLLAPAELATLARRLLDEASAEGPLCLRVAPADADIACQVRLVTDPGLQPGDAVLECREGDIDARLRVRLDNVLAAVGP